MPGKMNMDESNKLVLQIVNKIEHIIHRKLSNDEENLVITCIYKSRGTTFKSHDYCVDTIVNTVLSELQLAYQYNHLDTHEIMKRSIESNEPHNFHNFHNHHDESKDTSNNNKVNVESFFGVSDFSSIVKKLNTPSSSVNTAYLVLDTRYKILNNEKTKFSWGHINNLIRTQGTCNSVGDIRDIISIGLMPFRMPYSKSADTPYKRISVLIEEMSNQSFVAHEDCQYHFICSINDKNPAPGWIELETDKHCHGEYKFNKPITTINTITLSLGSPIEPIVFDTDRLSGSIINYTNPTTIQFQTNHNLLTNDIVYITNYNTINPYAHNNIINQMNIKSGILATVSTLNTITIPIDTSLLKYILTGTVTTYTNLVNITGVGTLFLSELIIGDRIFITNGANVQSFIIESILTNTSLIITSPYLGIDGIGLQAQKNNILSDVIQVYFGSKRIFFNLELKYLSN